MSPTEAETILTDENVIQAAKTICAIDRLHAQEFNLLEPHLRRLGKFSESNIVTASEKALEGWTYMCIPGNGNGIKMGLSVMLRGLQVIDRDRQARLALEACKTSENLTS